MVLAINTNTISKNNLIDIRIACHPIRLFSDIDKHLKLPQPLIIPLSMLPEEFKKVFKDKDIKDFGIGLSNTHFEFHKSFCIIPNALVLSYALAVVTSGSARKIYLAGFDGYPEGDSRNDEVNDLLSKYKTSKPEAEVIAITPTKYKNLISKSVYGIKMKACVVIPARFNSSRFPGKPIVKLNDKEMILWVAENCAKAVDGKNVYIATDDTRISKIVLKNGFQVIETPSNLLTGTDRVAEASKNLNYEIFVNVQGDEPLIDYKDILKAIDLKIKYPKSIINSYCEIEENENPDNRNIPKVAITEMNDLIYISRSIIPQSKKNISNYVFKNKFAYMLILEVT